MPAINVARTDTFEAQRQKINQIGNILSNISAGGSDLQTGNLKLGDGTVPVPSLAFISDAELGIIKSAEKTIQFVSGGKKIYDFSEEKLVSYKNQSFLKEVLKTDGISVVANGENYDPGTYEAINIIGGTGVSGLIDITVTGFVGTTTTAGANYEGGNYNQIALTGGTGTGALLDFNVPGIEGQIASGGSLYKPGNYTNVPLTGGSGTGAIGDLEVQGDVVLGGTISNPGSNYQEGTYPSVTMIGEPVQTYNVTIVSNVFEIDGSSQPAITLTGGNTYRFDVSDSSVSGYNFSFRVNATQDLNLDQDQYSIVTKGQSGDGDAASVYVVVKPGASDQLDYYSADQAGMGNTVSFTSGSTTQYGTGGLAELVVNSSGVVTGVTWQDSGSDYELGDNYTASAYDVGFDYTASGFLYQINSVSYGGEIFNVSFSSSGQNYAEGDTLGVLDSNIGGGGGSGFSFIVESDPGSPSGLIFNEKGEGYSAGDVLKLPEGVTGKSTTLNGSVTGVSATLGSTTSLTLASTSGILQGMLVTNDPGGTGELGVGSAGEQTEVASVNSGTTLTLSIAPNTPGSVTLNFNSAAAANEIELDSIVGIVENSIITQTSGAGQLAADTVVVGLNESNNTVALSADPVLAGSATLSFSPPYGTPTQEFEFTIDAVGVVDSTVIDDGGIGYSVGDILTVNSTDLTQPITYVVTVKAVKIVTFNGSLPASAWIVGDTAVTDGGGFGDPEETPVYFVGTNGSNLSYIVIGSPSLESGATLQNQRTSSTYTTNEVTNKNRYFFDDLIPGTQTLYAGNTYKFDISDDSVGGHPFNLSTYPDGIHSPSSVEVTGTFTENNPNVSVPSTNGITVGMVALITDFETSITIDVETVVSNVDSGSNTITLSSNATDSGNALITFGGFAYEDGVTSSATEVSILITETTPDLYVYCGSHGDMAGEDGDEILWDINPVNPKVFGSGLSLEVTELDISNTVNIDIKEGSIALSSVTGLTSTFDDFVGNTSLSVPTATIDTVNTKIIESADKLDIISINGTVLKTDVSLEDSSQDIKLTIERSTGNVFSKGEYKSLTRFNSNDKLFIVDETISSATSTDIILQPSVNRILKVNTNTAIIIPSGDNDERPDTLAENGAIRFNTDSQQYEGYSANTDSWSSLGGVRDLDGNTTILAEETIGANDNTLWFINDNVNTLKFTPEYQEFTGVKKIRSTNTSAPDYIDWTANTPVSTGNYLKYRNNIYLVVSTTSDGSTASAGSEPTDTSGNDFTHGNTTLKWFTTAVGPLTFEEISELRIDPLGSTNLVINNQLRFAQNRLSSTSLDIEIAPNGSQKTKIDSTTSLVIPVGDNNQKGNPERGSIRYNTTDTQFEGYNGAQWGGLGGVKDIDQDTKIEAETGPGNDEDILYFFNEGSNTLRLTTTALEFDTIDTITSGTSDSLALNAGIITFDSLGTTLDNTSATETFLFSTKTSFDIGLSSGLFTDHLLRLTDTGDVVFNLGFGTGIDDNITLLNNDLSSFNMKRSKQSSSRLEMTKGTINSSNFIVYNIATADSAKMVVTAFNTTTGDREVTEFLVTHKGTDIYFTDTGNLKSGVDLFSSEFDIDGSNNVRVTLTLDSNLTNGDIVEATIINTTSKR